MVDQEIFDRVSEPILMEYRLVLQGLRGSIAAISEDEWIRGESKGDIPVRQACHVLHTFDVYTGGYRIKTGHRCGIPVDTFSRVVEESAYPSRDKDYSDLTGVPDVQALQSQLQTPRALFS